MDHTIYFFSEDIEFSLQNENQYRNWIASILALENKNPGDISYIFCNDDYLLNINNTYLDHNYLTDIITFPYNSGDTISADIFISIDRVKENGAEYNVPFYSELLRVMAHGILHLVGYGDKSDDQKIIMRKKEEEAMALFEKII